MTEKEAIFQRHSVRNYTDKAIEPEKVSQIEEKVAQLNAEGNLHLQFVADAGGTYNKLIYKATGLASAPSIIACVGKDADDLDERVGYYGEKLVLFLQQLGLNTCWTGTYNKKQFPISVGEDERVVLVIAVGYGQTQGKTRKSKSAEQVTAGKAQKPDWFNSGVELALLAPTALNQQKFTIKLNDDDSVEIVENGGILSKVDLGIVKCHFEIGAERTI
ncbi:MAG: nitroreductase [Pseudobutyrivibrio sp.]|nr:nitroreductase [Pseudobutyrivibrio sp.]